MASRLLVISLDAFSEDNWAAASRLPHFRRLITRGAWSTKLRSIYPTLTYAIHTTIVTGCWPDRHGIVHNNPLQPFVKPKLQSWYWWQSDIRVPTLYDAAAKQGLRTAGIFWPVSGRSSLRWNLPELAALPGENQALKILLNGSPLYCLDLVLRHGRVLNGISQPGLDEFSARAAIDTIRRRRPDLLLLHQIELDEAKHHHGIHSPEVQEALEHFDGRLGRILDSLEEAGLEDETTVILLGDHGQIDIHHEVCLNQLLVRKGLVREDTQEWRAWFRAGGGSAFLHVRDGDSEALALAREALEEVQDDGRFGIEAIYGPDELRKLHANPEAALAVEARAGWTFSEELDGEMIRNLSAEASGGATHGYSPDKPGYKAVFIAAGPGIRPGEMTGSLQMTDLAPAMARILGIEFAPCDGQVPEELFSQGPAATDRQSP